MPQSTTGTSSASSSGSSIGTGAIVGAVIGSVFGTVLIAAVSIHHPYRTPESDSHAIVQTILWIRRQRRSSKPVGNWLHRPAGWVRDEKVPTNVIGNIRLPYKRSSDSLCLTEMSRRTGV